MRIAQFKDAINRYGIYSLGSAIDSSSMWAHYAEEHKGICIEFDAEALAKELESNYQAQWFSVEYHESRPRIESLSLEGPKVRTFFERAFGRKHESWGRELEWRAVAPLEKASEVVIAGGNPIHLFRVPGLLVRSITFGIKVPNRSVEAVADAIRKSELPHIKIFKAVPNNDEYRLDLVSLSDSD